MLINLKKLRQETGVSQKQLADNIGVSQQSINKYENHNIEPDIETLIRIADFFDTSVDYLVGHNNIRERIDYSKGFELNSEEAQLIEKYRKLPITKKSCIKNILVNFED